jgi:hypothetical protein
MMSVWNTRREATLLTYSCLAVSITAFAEGIICGSLMLKIARSKGERIVSCSVCRVIHDSIVIFPIVSFSNADEERQRSVLRDDGWIDTGHEFLTAEACSYTDDSSQETQYFRSVELADGYEGPIILWRHGQRAVEQGVLLCHWHFRGPCYYRTPRPGYVISTIL